MIGIDNSIIDLCKQLEIYIQSDYYKSQIAIGAFSTRFNKFWLENERAKDHLFMIDIIKGEANEKHKLEDELEDMRQSRDTWEHIAKNSQKDLSDRIDDIFELREKNKKLTEALTSIADFEYDGTSAENYAKDKLKEVGIENNEQDYLNKI